MRNYHEASLPSCLLFKNQHPLHHYFVMTTNTILEPPTMRNRLRGTLVISIEVDLKDFKMRKFN
jgi:hypothetical protein